MTEPSSEDKDPRIGRVLEDRFRLVEFLGEGSTASVYRAESLDGGPDFAVKLVKTPGYQKAADRARRIERFRREAMAISKLRHPNTVRLEHFGVTPGGQQYMVLELLDGRPWSEEVRGPARVDPPDLADIADIARHVALAIDEAHEIGIVHRDIKPANVVLVTQGPPGLVKVVDFGAASFDSSMVDAKLTAMGATVGSAPYMSPEQSRSETLTPASDVYSLGIVLYEALIGDVPFNGSFVEVMGQHNFSEPPRLKLSHVPDHVTEAWQALLDRMLEKTPEDRPTMAEVAVQLEKVSQVGAAAGKPGVGGTPASSDGADGGQSAGMGAAVYVIAAIVIAAIAVGAWFAVQ